MIIFRYLSREILMSTLAVSFVLLMIILSQRFVSLLADAAAGKYAVNVLLTMIVFRLPGFMEVILPLSFYLAVLLAYGRLYMESEMVVLSACGMSPRQLVNITLVPAAVVAGLVALFTLWLGPLGMSNYARIQEEQKNRSQFETLNPGRFQGLDKGKTVTFVKEITDGRKKLHDVFIARMDGDVPVVAMAQEGEQKVHPEFKKNYLVLHQGTQFEGIPGAADYRVTRFTDFGQYLQPVDISGDFTSALDTKPTLQLIGSKDSAEKTTLQWRVALPIMVFIITLLAIPMSKTNPRQGRFMKLLPAFLLFTFYYMFLLSTRSAMLAGKWPIGAGLWLVHAIFFLMAFLMLNWTNLKNVFAKQPAILE